MQKTKLRPFSNTDSKKDDTVLLFRINYCSAPHTYHKAFAFLQLDAQKKAVTIKYVYTILLGVRTHPCAKTLLPSATKKPVTNPYVLGQPALPLGVSRYPRQLPRALAARPGTEEPGTGEGCGLPCSLPPCTKGQGSLFTSRWRKHRCLTPLWNK